MDTVHLMAITMGASWAAGINLYAAVTTLGLLGLLGGIDLPPGWEILMHPLVIAAGGLMYMVEFTADKVPGGDSAWDAIHTFIRIPAGAVLAYSGIHDVDPGLALAATLVGSSMSAANHSFKSGLRLAINTSPEPFTNWAASTTEDGLAFSGVALAIYHPVLFLSLLGLWILLLIWAIPRIWRFVQAVYRRVRSMWVRAPDSRGSEAESGVPSAPEPSKPDPIRHHLEAHSAERETGTPPPLVVQVEIGGQWHDLTEVPGNTPHGRLVEIAEKVRSSGVARNVRICRKGERQDGSGDHQGVVLTQVLAVAAVLAAGSIMVASEPAFAQAASSLNRTTCPEDDVVGGSCLRNLHQQPREFWEQYQREAPALREGFLNCHEQRNAFGDWVSGKREDLRLKDRQWNMDRGGYLPHSVVEESSYVIQQMANAFIVTEYNQIINRGARPELCQERIAYWKAQILGVTEKFPPLREPQRHDGDGWNRPQ